MAAADNSSAQAVGLSTIVRQSEKQVAADLDGEVAMMSIENGEYYVLDRVASRAWELIEEPVKVGELCAKLMDEYEVDEETCKNDVLAFLAQMNKKGLIDVDEG